MQQRKLGNSDLMVSEISLGSWLTYAGGVSFEQAKACTQAAFDAGINLFDTANIYGRGTAEEAWGKILHEYPRDSYILATKLYFPMTIRDRGLSAKQIHKQLDASLKRLQTDYIDLYQCHRFDIATPIEETMEALTEVVGSGKVRAIGFSEWTPEQIRAGLAVDGATKFVSSQPQYNMLWRGPEKEVFPLCAEKGISQIVWSPLAQGILTGKYKPGEQPPPGSRAAGSDNSDPVKLRFLNDETLAAVQRLEPIAEEAGLSMVQLALAWVLRRPEVASAIIGASRPEQVHQNVAAAGVSLPADVLAAIDTALGDQAVREPQLSGSSQEGVQHRKTS